MPFNLPGVSGQPIAANYFTGKLRRMSGLIAWYTMVQRAQLLDPALFVPRGGAGLMTLVGAARYQDERGEQVSYFPSGGSDRWETPLIQMPSSRTFTLVCAFNASEGFTEPLGLSFSNGAAIWIKPNHGNNTGIEFLSSTGGTQGTSFAGVSASNNTPNYVIADINTSTGVINYKLNSGSVQTATNTAISSDIANATDVGLLVGVGRGPQPFVGRIMEAAWFRGSMIATPGDARLTSIAEYMSRTWGIV